MTFIHHSPLRQDDALPEEEEEDRRSSDDTVSLSALSDIDTMEEEFSSNNHQIKEEVRIYI